MECTKDFNLKEEANYGIYPLLFWDFANEKQIIKCNTNSTPKDETVYMADSIWFVDENEVRR